VLFDALRSVIICRARIFIITIFLYMRTCMFIFTMIIIKTDNTYQYIRIKYC